MFIKHDSHNPFHILDMDFHSSEKESLGKICQNSALLSHITAPAPTTALHVVGTNGVKVAYPECRDSDTSTVYGHSFKNYDSGSALIKFYINLLHLYLQQYTYVDSFKRALIFSVEKIIGLSTEIFFLVFG